MPLPFFMIDITLRQQLCSVTQRKGARTARSDGSRCAEDAQCSSAADIEHGELLP